MPPISVFRPATSLGTTFGAAVIALCTALGGVLLYKGVNMDVGPKQIGPFIAGGAFLMMALLYLYWTWSCRSLSYMVDRNALTIRWGGLSQVVPLASIERLVPAGEGESLHIEGVSWPGHRVGKATVDDLGEVLFYSSHRALSEVLYVQTTGQTYALSVPDHVAFAEAVQTNHDRGPLFDQRQAAHRWGIAAQSFWLDPWALALAFALIGTFVAVLAYTLQLYPGLGQSVALRFPSLVGVVRVTDKSALLDIPRSAAGFMALNLTLAVLLHSWERMVAYVVLFAGIGVQAMLLVAVIVAVAK
jgi:hypothetical protein